MQLFNLAKIDELSAFFLSSRNARIFRIEKALSLSKNIDKWF